MAGSPHDSPLVAHGFSLEARNGLVFVGFPDGHDGQVFEDETLAALDHDALLRLGNLRQQAMRAITAAYADLGWGMQSESIGHFNLGKDAASSDINLGLPLTYWLQHESLSATVRRFAQGFGEIDDGSLERALTKDASSESARLYEEHLARGREIDANAVEVEIDPAKQADWLQQIERHRKEAGEAHRAWLDTRRIEGSIDDQLAHVLDRYRADFIGGRGLWLASDRLWMSDTDDWTTREEWIEWAELSLDTHGMWGSGASVLMRFAPDRFREPIREMLVQAYRQHDLEGGVQDVMLGQQFPDDVELADFAFSPHTFGAAFNACADRDLLHGLFRPYIRLRRLLRDEKTTGLRDFLVATEEILNEAGHAHFHRLFSPTEREQLLRICFSTVEEPPFEPFTAAVFAPIVAKIALGLREELLAEKLLQDRFWQSAMLHRLNILSTRRFFTLKECILCLSLVAPGASCRELIARAAEHLDDAHEANEIDSTALALAVAWRRCREARR